MCIRRELRKGPPCPPPRRPLQRTYAPNPSSARRCDDSPPGGHHCTDPYSGWSTETMRSEVMRLELRAISRERCLPIGKDLLARASELVSLTVGAVAFDPDDGTAHLTLRRRKTSTQIRRTASSAGGRRSPPTLASGCRYSVRAPLPLRHEGREGNGYSSFHPNVVGFWSRSPYAHA